MDRGQARHEDGPQAHVGAQTVVAIECRGDRRCSCGSHPLEPHGHDGCDGAGALWRFQIIQKRDFGDLCPPSVSRSDPLAQPCTVLCAPAFKKMARAAQDCTEGQLTKVTHPLQFAFPFQTPGCSPSGARSSSTTSIHRVDCKSESGACVCVRVLSVRVSVRSTEK